MNTVQRFAKNTTALLLSQIFGYILALFYTVYTARYLGVEGFGVLSFALAFAGIFSILTDLGLSTLIVREVARDLTLASKYLGNATLVKTGLSIATFVFLVIIVNLSNYPQQYAMVIYFITLSFIMSSYAGTFNAIFQAYEKMEYSSLGQVLNNLLMLGGILLAIYFHFDVVGFAMIYFFANLICLVYAFIISSWKFVVPKLEIDTHFWKSILKESLPIAITGIFALIAFKVDIVMLEVIKDSVAVGWYSAAYRLMEALIFIPSMYTVAIYPILSRFFISSKESLESSFKKSFKYLFLIALPIAAGTTLLASDIILFVYKSSYTESIIALQILIWALPLIFISYVQGSTIVSINKQHETIKVTFFTMTLNIVLNLILIPYIGYVGAAITTVVTEFALFISYFYIISQHIRNIQPLKIIYKPIIATLIMCIFILLVDSHIMVMIIASTIIYFAVLFLLKTFTDEDINLFKQVINIKK
jgi:O-antigen/teichoic acid export membrane protein